jgi:hypothetical protein
MKPRRAFLVAALSLLSLSQAAENPTQETAEPRLLMGKYQVYGGSLSDMLPPTPNDRSVAFRFEGQTAKDLFEYLGPDVKKKKACTDDPEYRERRRGDLHCVHWKASGYRCFLGLDLRSGKSKNGSVC